MSSKKPVGRFREVIQAPKRVGEWNPFVLEVFVDFVQEIASGIHTVHL